MSHPLAAPFRLLCLLVVLGFAGCTRGRDFGRPDQEADLTPGRTTEAEILERFGPPTAVTSNTTFPAPGFGAMPTVQRALNYTYQVYPFLTPESGPPTRTVTFGFSNGILRIILFLSSFPSDQRDFDATAAKALLDSPQSGMREATLALGPPEARYVGPDGSTGGGWYVIRTSKEPDGHPIMTKMLVIKYGPDGRPADRRLILNDEP